MSYYEVIAAPYTVYVAPVGTAFPHLGDDVGGSWTKVGTSGDLDYQDEGVTVEHLQTIKLFRGLGSPAPLKAFLDEEGLLLRIMLADMTLEAYGLALNNQTPATTAAGNKVGFKTVGLSRGSVLAERSLLVRSLRGSGYGVDWKSQYEVVRAVQSGQPRVVHRRADATALDLEWTALQDPNASTVHERFGRLRQQNATAAS